MNSQDMSGASYTQTHGNQIRILVADDHDLLRQGVRAVIDKTPDMTLLAGVEDGATAIERFKALIPDVTLMDLRMPGIDGLAAIAAIRSYAPNARIIALSTYGGDALIKQARKAGARGYLLKSMLADNMLDAIRQVYGGQEHWPAELGDAASTYGDDLSPRERDVMRLVARGASNREIGIVLGISEETVKTYMRIILAKLRARDRAHAVAISLRRGFLDTSDLS